MVARITTGTTGASVSRVKPRLSVTVVNPATSVSRVVPVSEISYVYLSLSAELNSSGLYQYKADIAVVVDSTSFAFFKRLEETQGYAVAGYFAEDYTIPPTDVGVYDAISVQVIKNLADSVGTSDVCIPILVFLRDFTESLSATDVSVIGYGLNPADSVSLSDSDPVFGLTKALTDAFAMNDMADIGDGIAFQFDDYTNNVVTLSDGTSFAVSTAYTDIVVPADTPAIGFSRGLEDSVAESDALAISFSGAYTDTAVLTDNLAKSFSQSLTDSFGQSDAVSLASGLAKADSFSFSDTGAINVQNYAVADYFAADYVGTNYTF